MKKTIISMGIGAGLMYLLDPEHGAERRAQLSEKFTGAMPKTRGAVDAKVEALSAKAQDLTTKADDMAADAIASVPIPAEPGHDAE